MSDYPTAHTSERCLLSSVMRGGGDVRQRAVDKVRPEFFDRHDELAAVVLSIAPEGRPDPDTVRAEYGDEDELEQVLDERPAPQQIDRHIRSVQEAYGKRRLIDIAFDGVEAARNGQSFEQAATMLEKDVIDLTRKAGAHETSDMPTLVGEVLSRLEDEQGERITGVPTPFPAVNKLTRGLQDGELIIPFGSTSMGKTAWALTVAIHAAEQGTPTAIHSLEMSETALTRRLLQMLCPVDLRQTTIPDQQWSDVTTAAAKLSELPIYIEDEPGLDPVSHRSRLRRLKYEHNIGLAVVDYLQIMNPPPDAGDKKHHQVADAAQMVKGTAKIMDIPVIVPSQTTKGVDKRSGNKQPTLADLREAGEEPADVAVGLYRPEYYGITQWPSGGTTEGQGKAIISKQRNGPTGDVKLAFVEQRARWAPLEESPPNTVDDNAPTSNSSPF